MQGFCTLPIEAELALTYGSTLQLPLNRCTRTVPDIKLLYHYVDSSLVPPPFLKIFLGLLGAGDNQAGVSGDSF